MEMVFLPSHIYIITGASSGLRAELSKQLLQAGNYEYCLSRTENVGVKRQASGCSYNFYPIDLSRSENLFPILDDIFKTINQSDIDSITLINNAASVSPIKDIQYCTPEEIMANIRLNLTTLVIRQIGTEYVFPMRRT